MQRTKNAVRNATYGTLYRIVTILFPFVIRTVMLYIMGSEYVGLNSLFTSILSFLSLAELGIGEALVYSMYKPIAEGDKDSICALLNLYRRLYRYIGAIILAIGLLLLPFLKYLVNGGCPEDVSLYVLYLIYLFNTVISYWLFGYKQSLLTAHQRSDIISKRSLVIQSVMYVLQIVVLFISRNYYMYIILLPIFTIITNLANSIIVDRMYPEYKCVGHVSKEEQQSITKKVIALFGTKVNSTVMHSLDNIVISAFLGLTMVAQYGNYYYIMNAIVGVMSVIYGSLTAGLGNSLVTESVDKNYRDFNALSFLNAWIVAFCSVSLLCLYQPFMELWVGEALMFDMGVVILLVIYFYVYQIRRIVLTYKDAGGIWWEDRFRPYVQMLINITGNLIMVQFIGIYGVILSSIISMIFSIPWENYTVFKYIFKRSSKQYYKKLLTYLLITIICCAITWAICFWCPDGFLGLFLRAVICVLVPNVVFLLIYRKSEEFTLIKQRLLNLIK